MTKTTFNPTDIGFFHRRENLYPPEVEYYELDHPDIDKSIQNDWMRYNVFLSKDGAYVTIWVGVLELHAASEIYERKYGFELSYEQHHDLHFKGHIRSKEAGEVIWDALGVKGYTPGYLGPDG
ncbi:MAG: hypothetical protein AAF741_05050 [Bacteroidota bacterium]